MDAINPDYAVARKAYGDPASEAQHLEMGRDFKNMDDADIAEVIGKATPRNQAAFMQGAGKYLSDAVDKSGNDPAALKKLLNTDTLNKLRPAFNDDVKFNNFVDNLNRLKNEAIAGKTLNYGKEAANRGEAQAQVNATDKSGLLGLGKSVVDLVRHPIEGTANAASAGITKMQGNIPKDVSTIITRIMTSTDPNTLRYIHEYNMTKPPPAGIPAKVGAGYVGLMTNPLALPGIAANKIQKDSRKATQ